MRYGRDDIFVLIFVIAICETRTDELILSVGLLDPAAVARLMHNDSLVK